MRNQPIIIIAGILFVSLFGISCNKDKIKGTGKIISESRTAKNFYGVSVLGSTRVFIRDSTGFAITVKGYENIVPKLETIVENGILKIQFKKNTNITNDNSEVYIAMPSLLSILSSGSGDVDVSGSFLGMDYFTASTSGSANITIENGTSKNLAVNINGSGNIHSFGLKAESVTANINGSGNAEVSVLNSLKATIAGSGNVYYKGSASVTSSISGSGQVIKK